MKRYIQIIALAVTMGIAQNQYAGENESVNYLLKQATNVTFCNIMNATCTLHQQYGTPVAAAGLMITGLGLYQAGKIGYKITKETVHLYKSIVQSADSTVKFLSTIYEKKFEIIGGAILFASVSRWAYNSMLNYMTQQKMA